MSEAPPKVEKIHIASGWLGGIDFSLNIFVIIQTPTRY